MPQAQAITDAEPAVSGSDNVPQAGQDLVVVSFDDIEDGPGEPPGCPGSRALHAVSVPQALRSRGGIMLDTAAVPPSLTPLGLADGTRVGPQPIAMA